MKNPANAGFCFYIAMHDKDSLSPQGEAQGEGKGYNA